MNLKSQRHFTDELLFKYYLLSSSREEEVFSPIPAFLDRSLFNHLQECSHILHGVTVRLLEKLFEGTHFDGYVLDDFPFREEIVTLPLPLPPLFWGRYDAFCQADGSIFFTEFNYDKPCAEREILVSEVMNPRGNPNSGFSRAFRDAFDTQLQSAGIDPGEPLSITILADPCHYEESHLAHLFMDLLEGRRRTFTLAGAQNIEVKNGRAWAFGKAIDILLRQYPTEFLHEIEDCRSLLELAGERKLLIVNDPRAVLVQAKSFFSLLTDLAVKRSPLLTDKERAVIEETIPRTRLYSDDQREELTATKDQVVIKSVLGRYSEEVYLGIAHTPEEWLVTLDYVQNSPKKHIVQEFRHIKVEAATRYYQGNYLDLEGFCNYGVFLCNGAYAGLCARWTEEYLTGEESVWFTSVGIREKSFEVLTPATENRQSAWEDLNDRAAFQGGYSGGYTGTMEYFTLQALRLDQALYSELVCQSEKLCILFQKVTGLVRQMGHLFFPLLGINETLRELVEKEPFGELSFIGRLDWVVDSSGSLKVLEFNSETPAGLMESTVLYPLVHDLYYPGSKNPNTRLGEMITGQFEKIMARLSSARSIKKVGIVSSTYYEDWHNTEVVYELVRKCPFTFIMGEVSGLEARQSKLWLYGEPLDAIFRYYPLDWFDSDPYYSGVIDALGKETSSINPASTIVTQSKAFFALLWEMARQGLLEEKEIEMVRKYIPITELEADRLHTPRFCIKPYFGREGQGIKISTPLIGPGEERDRVYQEMIDVQPIHMEQHTAFTSRRGPFTPVIGVYITGCSYAGLFVRAGSRITDKRAMCIPVVL